MEQRWKHVQILMNPLKRAFRVVFHEGLNSIFPEAYWSVMH